MQWRAKVKVWELRVASRPAFGRKCGHLELQDEQDIFFAKARQESPIDIQLPLYSTVWIWPSRVGRTVTGKVEKNRLKMSTSGLLSPAGGLMTMLEELGWSGRFAIQIPTFSGGKVVWLLSATRATFLSGRTFKILIPSDATLRRSLKWQQSWGLDPALVWFLRCHLKLQEKKTTSTSSI